MTLPELSIKRHVLAFMLSGVLVLFGIISYQRLASTASRISNSR